MTISHSKPGRYSARAIKVLLGAMVVFCLASIFLYNRMVDGRQRASQYVKSVDTLKVENTKLKNDLYTLIDSRSLTIAVERLGYIKDSNPGYLTFLADGSVRDDQRVTFFKP